MQADSQFPTPAENIVIDLLYEWLRERRCNRTMGEYLAIAARIPKVSALHAYVNQRLQETATRQSRTAAPSPYWPYEICDFKAGDRHISFRKFPTSLSKETVRTALKKSGLRQVRAWANGEESNLFEA